ncbi:serine/threonine-protein kinase atr-like isoform X2 [Oratosquilla oratoria]|uniref:serine/threonine-protein kinase atr-like isoform X2 n=1 Tax=Oratosquilla oratoria TaxID=337810 RepID=UPI003F76FB29
MADEKNQHEALREKFVSVVTTVLSGGDEGNILMVLNSLTNICRNDEGLLVDTAQNSEHQVKELPARAFSCWLLSVLVELHGSDEINSKNRELQVNILQLLANKNKELFASIIKELIIISKVGTSVLLSGGTGSHSCFSSILSDEEIDPKPKIISFDFHGVLDITLCNLISVLCGVGNYINLYCTSGMEDVWLVTCQCLEAGDDFLKLAALNGISHLFNISLVPQLIQTQDYLLQCIQAVIFEVAKRSIPSEKSLISDMHHSVCDVLQRLKNLLNKFSYFLTLEIVSDITHVVTTLPGYFELSRSCQNAMIDCISSLYFIHAAHPFKDITLALGAFILKNIWTHEEISCKVLEMVVTEEVMSATLNKRQPGNVEEKDFSHQWKLSGRFSQVMLEDLSSSWGNVINGIAEYFETWDSRTKPSTKQIKTFSFIVKVSCRIVIKFRLLKLQVFPSSLVNNMADSLLEMASKLESKDEVEVLMAFISTMTWMLCGLNQPVNNNALFTLLAITTLPWMATEVSWLDLNVNKNKVGDLLHDLKYFTDYSVKIQSIPVLALLPKEIAPKWRCHVVRAIAGEGRESTTAVLAEWFPIVLHQLGSSSHHLVGDVMGIFLRSNQSSTTLIAVKSLSCLLCVLLNFSVLRCKSMDVICKPDILHCTVCQPFDEGESQEGKTNIQEKKQVVDPSLLSQFYCLLSHQDISVIVALLNALTSVVHHATITPEMTKQILGHLKHSDELVAKSVCRQLPFLVFRWEPQKVTSFIDQASATLIFDHLSSLLKDAVNEMKNFHVVLNVVREFVKYPLTSLTIQVLQILLVCLLSSNRLVIAEAHMIMQELARNSGLHMKELYSTYRQSLAQLLAETVKEGDVMDGLSHIAAVFDWDTRTMRFSGSGDVGTFVSSQLPYLLPYSVVRAAREKLPSLLQELAACMGLRLRDMLIDHFQHILAHLVFHNTEEEKQSVLQFISDTTDINIYSIRRCSVQNQVNELVLGLHDYRDAVLKELSQMRALDEADTSEEIMIKRKQSFRTSNMEDIAKYLSPRLLGILGFLDGKLVSRSTMYREKKCAFSSLCDLLTVMGCDNLSPFAHKVLASLKTALKLKDEEFYDISCKAWTSFLDNLDEVTLGALLEEVVVVITPLVRVRPEEMAPVLKRVIMDKGFTLSLVGSLPLLPEHSALDQINEFIQGHQTSLDGGGMEAVLQELRIVLRGLAHESVDVRLHAFTRLRRTLYSNQATLYSLEEGSDSVPSVISELFSILLNQCGENDPEIQIFVAECLGLLGAVDPASLYTKKSSKEELRKIHLSFETDDYVHDLVTELARAFLSATDASTQTCASYAMQMFSVCRPIMRRDTTTAIFLLPHIFVSVLCDSSKSYKPILTEVLAIISHEDEEQPVLGEFQHMAVQIVFSVMDYVSKWTVKQWQSETVTHRSKSSPILSPELKQVIAFQEKIPANLLAKTSFSCQAYTRALRHLESYIQHNPKNLKEELGFLQRIYVALDEPDCVAGVAAIRQEEPSLWEQLIQHESTGRLQDALNCYERLCVEEGTANVYQGMLRCFLNLNQPHSVLSIAHGLITNAKELEYSLNEYRVEAAWRLGQWDQLESWLNIPSSSCSWGIGIGTVLLAIRQKDEVRYQQCLRTLRSEQIAPLRTASMEQGAYQHSYPYILRLQMLKELEDMMSGFLGFGKDTFLERVFGSSHSSQITANKTLSLSDLVKQWNSTLALTQTSYRTLEPILSFRRTLFHMGAEWLKEEDPALADALKTEMKQVWLHSAKVARKAGYIQQGEWALHGAGISRDVFVEKAKWQWLKGEQHQAVKALEHGIDNFFPNATAYKGDATKETQEERAACGKAKLLLARYSEDSATLDTSTITQYYRDACEINRQWEDGHFHLAKYYDRILNTLDVKEKPIDWLVHIVFSFGKSLNFGCRHIYQSMPRMLSIWLDHGSKVDEMQKIGTTKSNASIIGTYETKLGNMNSFMVQLLERLPHYMFLTALPQLISRVCHSHNEVFIHLRDIIATVLASFPQQAMWHMIAVSKSSYHIRVTRCMEIFRIAKEKEVSLNKFISDATKLADKFLELSNKPVEKGTMVHSLNALMRSFPRLVSDPNFSSILLPLQQQMRVTLPTSAEGLHNHNPFPRSSVYVAGIEDRIEIMQSLQLPKKITLKGSDGQNYVMMCKPKDDLRKDCRLMEFNAFVNRCLLREPESRKRSLHIRTYTVVPLNEECGLIEWVPNLTGLRQILHRLYRDCGKYTSGQELKQLMCKRETPLATKRDIYLNKLVPKHPPVFSEWFLKTFPDPQAWYMARLSYCRTTAVMSMVGYILGLGDRHGENILFDSSNGDTVHVDFNCLFNKGENFDWPERVPFRLTHNMVAAMGPTGCEGVYRITCEVTLRVIREEREALMSVLRPFIHDPLVEWSRRDKKSKTTGEINNEKAQAHVRDIEQRLSGQIRTKSRGVNLPLSVEGQVNALIQDATSIDNLCQMYIGWAAYM